MDDSDKLPGQPSCLSHACVALLSGKIGQVSSLLPVMAYDEPRTQTRFRLVHGWEIFSSVPGLTFRSYPAHQLATCPAPTGPA